MDKKDPASGHEQAATDSGTVRRGGAAASHRGPDSDSPVTLRRSSDRSLPKPPRPPGADAPRPGAIVSGPHVGFSEEEDPAEWTLNTPAIQVIPADAKDFPPGALTDDTSSPDLFGSLTPSSGQPGSGPAAPALPLASPAQRPGAGPPLAPPAPELPAGFGGAAAPAMATVPDPLRAKSPDPVTLPNALKGERPTGAHDAAAEDTYLGTTIGDRYVIDDVLGEGGMGRVYLAHHKVIDKKLAIKILHAELVKDKEALGRFLREAKAASSIGNPHIVDISDFGETPDGSTYFVMEYLDGFTLGDLIEERQLLPVDLVLEIALQLADGLAAAHAQEIVHRDLKPENVTLIRRGKQDHFCKILDFGIAKVSTGMTAEKLTMAGAVFGTPHYMSPEQAAGAAVDHRTDIYSLGVMLYEMVSGELPFNADNFMGILTQHMYKAPVPIRALVSAPECPPGLEAIVLKCLSKKPDARYPSMGDLAEDLQRLKAGQIPVAVGEMMARSGSFNVPADYFKKGDAIVPATPRDLPRRGLSPRLAWVVAAAVCVVIALAVVFRNSITTAQPQPAPDGSAAATEPQEPTDPAEATGPAAQAPAGPASRSVLIAAEPVEAQAWVDGLRVELPASVPVPVGQTVSVDVKLEGYEAQTVVLDGSEERKTIKLSKLTGSRRIIRRPATPAPKPGGKAPKSGSSEVVDPWAK